MVLEKLDRIDDAAATAVIESYRQIWEQHRDKLPPVGGRDARLEAFASGYPLHPELIDTLREKMSTLGNFQRVIGIGMPPRIERFTKAR